MTEFENTVKIGDAVYKTIQDKMIVKVDQESTLSRMGLILMNHKPKYRMRTGRIICIGPGRLSEKTGQIVPPRVKAGERILYNTYSLDTEMEIKTEDESYELQFLREVEILAVIDDEDFRLSAL